MKWLGDHPHEVGIIAGIAIFALVLLQRTGHL